MSAEPKSSDYKSSRTKTRPLKICIVSPYAYPLFNSEQRRTHFGGSEVRVSLIAKELAKCGRFFICMVVWDHGQPHIERRQGVTVYSWLNKTSPPEDPPDYPKLSNNAPISDDTTIPVKQPLPISPNVLTSKWSKIKRWIKNNLPWRAWLALSVLYVGFRGGLGSLYGGVCEALKSLYGGVLGAFRVVFKGFGLIGDHLIWYDSVAIFDEVDADIYLVPGNHDLAAEVSFYCKKRNKKYVFLAGSDFDYLSAYKTDPDKLDIYGVSGYLKVYTIENASLHIVQSEHQAKLLQQGYSRSSIVVRNPIVVTPLFPRNPDAKTILWVGSSDERVRRPSVILELARRLPEYSFVVVLVPAIQETYHHCLEIAKSLTNVTLVGRTPFREVEQYFANAKLFANTSVFEGFPNTFLQAAKYGVPIIAAQVDPGEMLSWHGCGLSCNDDLDQLEKAMRLFMTDAELYAKASTRCLNYVHTYHDKDKIIPQYEKALASLRE